MFDLKRAWNCNMRLKAAVRRAAKEGISKETVVKFWRDSARKLGYWGSYPISKVKNNPLTKSTKATAYTDWKGETGAGLMLRQIIANTCKE